MKVARYLTFGLLAVLLAAGSVSAQVRTTTAIHTVQVRIFVPDGVTPPQLIRVSLDSERSGQSVNNRTLIRDTFTEFQNLTNGEYSLNVTTDNDKQIEPYIERFSLRSNFPLLKQFSVFLKIRVEAGMRPPGTPTVGTIDARRVEIPKSALKAFEKGVEKAGKGKIEEAIKAFQEAVDRHPEYFEAINNLGVQYMKLMRFDEALVYLRRAAKVAPESPFPHLNIGIIQNEQKNYTEAIESLAEAIRLNFKDPLAHYQIGLAYYNTKDHLRAQLEFEIAAQSAAQRLPLTRLYLADLYKRSGRNQDAIVQLETFLREQTDNNYTEVVKRELEKLKQPQN